MPKISLNVKHATKQAVEKIAEEYDMSMSDVVRMGIESIVEKREDILPEHVKKNYRHQDVVEEQKHKRRRFHFRNNVREELDKELERAVPAPPSEAYEDIIKGRLREAEEEHTERTDEYKDFVKGEYLRYTVLHPSTTPDMDDVMDVMEYYYERGLDREAEQIANKVADTSPHINPSDIIDQARRSESISKKRWGKQWEEAVGKVFDND